VLRIGHLIEHNDRAPIRRRASLVEPERFQRTWPHGEPLVNGARREQVIDHIRFDDINALRLRRQLLCGIPRGANPADTPARVPERCKAGMQAPNPGLFALLALLPPLRAALLPLRTASTALEPFR